MPGTAARTLACAADALARFLKLRYEGIAIASRIPRMMMTTRSSISVKPLSSRATRCRRLSIMLRCLLPDSNRVQRWLVRYRRPDRGDLSPKEGHGLDRCRESHASPPEPGCARREANGAANAGTTTRAAGPANDGGTQRLARRGLVGKPGVSLRLTDALRDRGRRAALEVGDGGRVRVLDAVVRVRWA